MRGGWIIETPSNQSASGAIYVGAFVLRTESRGAIVTAAAVETRPRPIPRKEPARLLPPTGPALVDRALESEIALGVVTTGHAIEFFGDEGVGKTTLLAHLAHLLPPDGFPHGVLHLSAHRASLDDIVQALYEALFECPASVKVSAAQLREIAAGGLGWEPRRALVLIDDVELEPEAVEELIAALPACPFVLATPERMLWSEGRARALERLSEEDALALFERALGRPLQPDERPSARSLVEVLGGRALAIVLAAGLARAETMPPAEVDRRMGAESITIEALAVSGLDADERRMAAALAAVGGAETAIDDLAAIAGVADPRAALDGLARRGVARRAGERFGMPVPLVAEVGRAVDIAPFEERAITRFAAEAGRRHDDAAWAAAEVVVVLEVLERAITRRRWDEAIEIARGVEGGLTLSGRWGAWGRVLDLGLQAARHRENAALEAWALHQRGTRALGLGAFDAARQDLEGAVVLRQAIGDEAGAAASRRNLEHVPGAPVVIPAPSSQPVAVHRTGPSAWFFLALALGIVALLTVVILAASREERSARGGALVFDADEVDWGENVIGVVGAPRTIVVENDGETAVTVRAVRLEGEAAAEFVIARDGCSGRTLPPGARCEVEAVFVPGSAGRRAARLVFEGAEGVGTVALVGTGGGALGSAGPPDVVPAAVAVSPMRVEFGPQDVGTSSGPVPISFVNTGTAPVRLGVRLDASGREFAIARDACSNRVVPPGGTCIVEVMFRPRGEGARGAVLVLRDIATSATWTVALAGAGAGPGAVEVVGVPAPTSGEPGAPPSPALRGPDRIAFGVQRPGGRSATERVTLENVRGETIRIANARLAGIDAVSFGLANDRCSGFFLRPGETCTLDVWFEPRSAGEKRANLVVRDGTGDVAREVVVTGTGG